MSTNSQPAVGIAGVQAAARSSGSTTRAESKKFFLLAIRWAPLIGLLLALAFLWKDYSSKPPTQKGDAPTATTSAQAVRQEAKWARLADGSIPVGVWSGAVVVFPQCGVQYAPGCGKVYAVQYRKDSSQWIDQTCGTNVELDGFRIKFLTSGNKEFPVKENCS